ncbi:transcriptional regulator [Roseateles aquatilis]|uniref:Transcriptional regulator n=2 Tax=Roseateles aquatilis TaxID=431061 RepID=A0A246JH99_9BURK|nr:transcriptional regulator [Roseateles aquatilis]
MWAKHRRWVMPQAHVRACQWLEHRGEVAVFRAHRGFSKSTLLAGYNAWRYYRDPTYRILHQGEADGTAYKTSRDTQHVLRNHPLTRGMFREGGVEQWWVQGASDPRNASMYAKGILSNVTSARADECQNDDVEVPRNIQTPEAREKLRYRLGEQTHILVPGGRQLYVGTPHTHDSLYDEQEEMGADCLTIRMFEQEFRLRDAAAGPHAVPFPPEFVFSGIGKHAKLLELGKDYTIRNRQVVLKQPAVLIDFYAGVAWPERFDGKELLKRRRKTRTINEWDSQYQLHSKPIHDVRLNPDAMVPYDAEPTWRRIKGMLTMWLGDVQIVGASCRWDPSSGKLKSDVSAVAVLFQDESGRRYLHRIVQLIGKLVEFREDGATIKGGQVHQLCDLVEKFRLPRVTIETNGIGGFAPSVLKGALMQRKLQCGVAELDNRVNKNKRILEALEPLLMTDDQLWAHVSVLDSEEGEEGKGLLPIQMRDWNAALTDQEDDYVDAAAGAVTETPERVMRAVAGDGGIPPGSNHDSWRPSSGAHQIEIEAGIVE